MRAARRRAARSGGRCRARSGRRTCGRRGARARPAAASRSPVGITRSSTRTRSQRGQRNSHSRRGASGNLHERMPAERDRHRGAAGRLDLGGEAQPVLVEAGVDRHDVRERERAQQVGVRAVVEARRRAARRARRPRRARLRTARRGGCRASAARWDRWGGRARGGRPRAGRRGTPAVRAGCPTGARAASRSCGPRGTRRAVRGHATYSSPPVPQRRAQHPAAGQERRLVLAGDERDRGPFHVPSATRLGSARSGRHGYWFGLSPLFAAASRSASAARIGIGSWPTSAKRAASSSTVQRPSLRISRTSVGWFHTATRPPLTV